MPELTANGTFGVALALAVAAACGASGARSRGPAGAPGDEAGAIAEADGGGPAAPASGDDAATDEPAPAPGSADEAFLGLLDALAAGATRRLREMIPPDGSLALLTRICRRPVYGVGTCRDERADADRRRVRDDIVSRWQELLGLAASADPAFAVGALVPACEASGGTVRCTVVVPFGTDGCRGDLEATVSAVILRGAGGWQLLELGYDENILICR